MADTTGTPVLEDIILGKAPMSNLPEGCMIWTGATHGGNGPRVKVVGKKTGYPVISVVTDPLVGKMRWKGKYALVHRVVFELVAKPDYEFRMSTQCNVPCCVNPRHWEVTPVVKKHEFLPDDIPFDNGEWTLEEVEGFAEILLTEQYPKNWQDVISAPLMTEVPHDLLRQVLIKLNKKHLT